ncbi:MAG: multicopper oxidase family protein [Gemmatimonadaceae bacterium]
MLAVLVPFVSRAAPLLAQHAAMHGGSRVDSLIAPSARSIVPMIERPMIPGLVGARPAITPFVAGVGVPLASLAAARPRRVIDAADGDTVDLDARLVRRSVAGRVFTAYAFDGGVTGPLIRMRQGATLFVRFSNHIDLPSTIHWHGVRLDNASDGAPGLTQAAVAPGASVVYKVHAPDAGIFWYHDHVREDVALPLGLAGNLRVESARADYYSGANAEEVLMIGDILLDAHGPIAFGTEAANFALMGRVGNVLLVNGAPSWELRAGAGDVIRFLITNASSARTFNLSFISRMGDAPIKLVAADVGRFEREVMVPSVVIGPAQRYVAEVRFPRAGDYYLANRVQAVDHFLGEFIAATDTVGRVRVSTRRRGIDHGAAFRTLRSDSALETELARFRPHFDRAPDHELALTTEIAGLPIPVMQFLSIDTAFRAPIEWTDGMSDMNWLATTREVRWILRDQATGEENMDIQWRIGRGDVVKIRLFNDPRSLHPMSHPIHIHGQRFLVLARDGVRNDNLAWKDTEIVPVGSTVDILVDASNPGRWMLHCHIAEHLQAGMMMPFTVGAR